jgi:hypothetical protein
VPRVVVLFEFFSSGPQALKRWFIFDGLTARFPFVMNSEFFRSL